MSDIGKKAVGIAGTLSNIRRDIHKHPELSFQEHRTAGVIAGILEKAGIEVRRGVAGTGVVGILRGAAPGKCVALRGDMDALPIEEKTGAEYASVHQGVMHACGHDVHTTCVLGAAILLASLRESIPGTVKFIFQPAEEKNMGAKEMLKEHVLSDPDVDAIFGLHAAPSIPAGKVGIKAGPLMAAVDTIRISVLGEGGHGAVPDRARDAIVAAASVIQNLQTVVSRKISPFDQAVVSIGTLHGGQANNIIADKVEMGGTVRTYSSETRRKMPELLKNIITHTCSALDTEGELEYFFDLPPLVNDPECAEIGRNAAIAVLGAENVVEPSSSGGGEDFAVFLEHVPGA
ncbi:MAG: M20 family metallopeptidase [Thermovirgaceae bacterium]|nr:M20 family metallopeptidase [Thermovirgaceae bacterium]